MIGPCLRSLLEQNYPGSFSVILVDDQSRDGTADVAAKTAAISGAGNRLTILSGLPLPAGWTGKVWAMKQGIEHAATTAEPPDYLLLTDADIAYAPDALRRLVARACAHRLVSTSLMVKLNCERFAERSLVPAFVFFFQMLYPFAWVNRTDAKTAAAAGGCMLVAREALQSVGGMEGIRSALIDDCALAAKLKAVGPIWLALTDHVRSVRPYPTFGHIRRMVARSAYCQLGYSPMLLVGTVAAMALTFLVPPLMAIFGSGLGRLFAILIWMLMAASLQPILRLYRLSPLWGLALPVTAACYIAFALDSAYQHLRRRGGLWKGRAQANLEASR
jgi:hopene-associated glycosyltransferase HpnB